MAEAEGRLGTVRGTLPRLVTETAHIRREIGDRQADEARFHRFLKRATDAQDKMSMSREVGAAREAEEALEPYGILANINWWSRLESSYLSADRKGQVKEAAYVTLVSLADHGVRWLNQEVDPKAAGRSLDLLRRAEAFHDPTRAFYFVRGECYRRQGNTAASEEDVRKFRAAVARTAWDHFLPGHTAGWGGDVDEAIRSYHAALALQPNHYNSLYFLASRLASDRINRRPEAIAYFSACLAVRPTGINAYEHRAGCYLKLGRSDAAEADFTAAIAAALDDGGRSVRVRVAKQVLQRPGTSGEGEGRQGERRSNLAKSGSRPREPRSVPTTSRP